MVGKDRLFSFEHNYPVNGSFKSLDGTKFVSVEKDLTVYGISTIKMFAPNNMVLSSTRMRIFEQYIEFIFNRKVLRRSNS